MGNVGVYGSIWARDGKPIQDELGNWSRPQLWSEHFDNDDMPLYRLAERYQEKYGYAWTGRHRCTFDRGDGWVIKVPHNRNGEEACLREVLEYERRHEVDSTPMAHCYLEISEFDPTFTVLVMEWVNVESRIEYDKLPEWALSIDCCQVGYTADGRLVAYDL